MQPDNPTVAALIAMRELLARDGGWTQLTAARRADGRKCSSSGRHAVSFCLQAAARRQQFPFGCAAVNSIRRIVGPCIPDWNDAPGRTQADVLAVIDVAIVQERMKQ